MSNEQNPLLALKNACAGVISASQPVQTMAAAVEALPAETPPGTLDLDGWHRAVEAQANAVMALRGLVNELRRREHPAA